MDVERSGARVVTGGMDYQVCLYDFNGMKADGRPFRELMPQEGHPVHAVTYSPSGDALLVVTGEPRAKVCAGAMPLLPPRLPPSICPVKECLVCHVHLLSGVCDCAWGGVEQLVSSLHEPATGPQQSIFVMRALSVIIR